MSSENLTDRKRLALARLQEVKRLAQADMADIEIAERLKISVRHTKTLRIAAGVLRSKRRPRRGWAATGLRISNLPDPEIAELYRGSRYG